VFYSSHRGCPSVERPVHSRSYTLSDWTGSFTECTPAPHLRDWTGSFAEHTYKVLLTLNAVVQLQLHYAASRNVKTVLLPRCFVPLHRPLPSPPRPHLGTLQDAVHSRFGRQQRGQKLWSASEAQVLAHTRNSSFAQRCSPGKRGSSCQLPSMRT